MCSSSNASATITSLTSLLFFVIYTQHVYYSDLSNSTNMLSWGNYFIFTHFLTGQI